MPTYHDLFTCIRSLTKQLENTLIHQPQPMRTTTKTLISFADALVVQTMNDCLRGTEPDRWTDEQLVARMLTQRTSLMWAIDADPNYSGTTSVLIRTMNRSIGDSGPDPGGAELVFDINGRLCRIHSWKAGYPPTGFFARLRWAWRWRIQIIPEETV